MKKNRDGAFLLILSLIGIVGYILLTPPMECEAEVKTLKTSDQKASIVTAFVQGREDIETRWEEHVAELQRIAERNALVEDSIYGYTSNEETQNYIWFAWEQFEYYGWSAYDLDCLITLWHRESKWNPLAHNSSSGAHGIPQSLPASKMAECGDDYWNNGYTQILWGLQYIRQRYGTPQGALGHSNRVGWY